MQEEFSVILVNATGGKKVSSRRDSTSSNTITCNDYLYRPFSFLSVFHSLTVSEDTSVVIVTESFGWREWFNFSCGVFQLLRLA